MAKNGRKKKGTKITENKQLIQTLYEEPAFEYLNEYQKDYGEKIKNNQITFCSGPAGTGKSIISFFEALKLLHEPNNSYEKLILITPAVETEEQLGHLPGDVNEKLEPFIYSSFYLIDEIIGKESRLNLKSQNILQVLALAYLRGVNIDNAILIFEEAQNSTISQMKTLLSRIGKNSKFIISGDIKQVDRFKKQNQSGLIDAMSRLTNINDITQMDFENADIVRNPLIEEILTKYEE